MPAKLQEQLSAVDAEVILERLPERDTSNFKQNALEKLAAYRFYGF